MLEGYEKLSTGVIKQVNATPPTYDDLYIRDYNLSIGGVGDELSYLRLGLLLGSLNQSITKLLDVGYGDGNFLSKRFFIQNDLKSLPRKKRVTIKLHQIF